MPLPIFGLTTTGADPKLSTRQLLETDVNTVVASLYHEISAVVGGLNPRGSWDASAGTFPSGTAKGDYYIVSVAGTVDSQVFAIGDWLVSLTADASTSTFAVDWFRAEYSLIDSDQFSAIAAAAAASAATAQGNAVIVTKQIYDASGLANPLTLPFAPTGLDLVDVHFGGGFQYETVFTLSGAELTCVGGWPLGIDSVHVKLYGAAAVADTGLELLGYTRAEAAGLIAANDATILSRSQIVVGGFTFDRELGATTPADLPGFVPNGMIYAEHFGALGDGSTDDTAAFTAAAAYGDFELLANTYIVEGWEVSSNRTITGRKGTVLKVKASSTSSPMLLNCNTKEKIDFVNITFDGNEANVSSFNNVVQSFNSTTVRYIRCTFTNTLGIASLISGGSGVEHIDCVFKDCGIRNRTTSDSADRRQAVAYTGSVRGVVKGCDFDGIGLDPISFASSSDNFLAEGNRVRDGDAAGMYFSSSKGGRIIGNDVATSDGNGIDVPNCESVTVTGNIVSDNGAAGILLANVKNSTVTGNVCRRNYQAGTSVHSGGITLSATAAGGVDNVTINNNVCDDDQVSGSVTQRYAVGVYSSGGGTYLRVKVGRDNQFTGYNGSGAQDKNSVFQTQELGILGFPTVFNLADNAEIKLYEATEFFDNINVLQINNNYLGVFMGRDSNSPIEMHDPSSYYELTDTGTTKTAIYLSGSDVMLKNRHGSTRGYVVWRG